MYDFSWCMKIATLTCISLIIKIATMQSFLVLLLLCTLVFTTVDSRQVSRALTVSNGATWGYWGNRAFCPTGSYAVGYKMQIEEAQGNGDDTALNNIGLICSDGAVITGHTYSRTWGNWVGPRMCDSGQYLTEFRLRVQSDQGSADDTGANSIKFKCSSGRMFSSELGVPSGLSGLWGTWGRWSNSCSFGDKICGLQINFENAIGESDDTGLNDVKLFCCSS